MKIQLTTLDRNGKAIGYLGLAYSTVEEAREVATGSNPERWGHLGDWREKCPAIVTSLRIDEITSPNTLRKHGTVDRNLNLTEA